MSGVLELYFGKCFRMVILLIWKAVKNSLMTTKVIDCSGIEFIYFFPTFYGAIFITFPSSHLAKITEKLKLTSFFNLLYFSDLQTWTNRLSDNARFPKPQGCPDALYEVMLKCWKHEPDNRPKFSELKHVLKDVEMKVT